MSLVTPAFPDDCSYVRLVMDGEIEIVYWDWKEWEEDPKVVMGAIVGWINDEQHNPDSNSRLLMESEEVRVLLEGDEE